MPKPRPEYRPMDAAAKVLLKHGTDLNDKFECARVVKMAKIKLSPTILGKVRKKLLIQNGGISTTSVTASMDHLDLVLKTINKVGGIENLKTVVTLIEKIKGKV